MSITIYTDDFDGNTDNPLAGEWSTGGSYGMKGLNNSAVGTDVAEANISYLAGRPLDNSQYVQFVTKDVSSASYAGVVIRYQNAAQFYNYFVRDNARMRIQDSDGHGMYTWNHAVAAGVVARVEVDADFLFTAYYDGVAESPTYDDTYDESQSGFAGLMQQGIGDGNGAVDDFECGNMARVGNTNVGPNARTLETHLRGIPIVMPADGTVTSVTAYLSASGATGIAAAIYSSGGTKLGQSSERNDISSAGWYTFTGFGTINLVNGTTYYIVVGGESANFPTAYYDFGYTYDGYNEIGTVTDAASLPATATLTIDGSGRDWSIYLTYGAAGGLDIGVLRRIYNSKRPEVGILVSTGQVAKRAYVGYRKPLGNLGSSGLVKRLPLFKRILNGIIGQ